MEQIGLINYFLTCERRLEIETRVPWQDPATACVNYLAPLTQKHTRTPLSRRSTATGHLPHPQSETASGTKG